MNFLQLNKFSELHNNSSIIFCKTDYLDKEFINISERKKDCILISGNSDYAITDDFISYIPKYVKKWFAQNAISNNDLLIPIPLGLENKKGCYRDGHGIGYEQRVSEKENIILSLTNKKPEKFIYANFNIKTNINHRSEVKEISIIADHIDWEEPYLTLENLYSKFMDYKMILCPAGNGVDTHRLWEVLYCGVIPVTVKTGNYKIYNMYEKFPIVLLDNNKELLDRSLIEKKYLEAQSKLTSLKEKLDYNYWKNLILKDHYNE